MSLIEDNISQNDNTFPHRLACLIKEQNLSQADVCKKTGISKQALHHYLSGTRIPRSDTLLTLSELLNVSMKYLLTGESDRSEIDTKGLTDIQIQKVSEYASLFRISNAVKKELPISLTDMFQLSPEDTDININSDYAPLYERLIAGNPGSGKTIFVSKTLKDARYKKLLSESISRCPNCRHRILSGYAFCPYCGKKIVV